MTRLLVSGYDRQIDRLRSEIQSLRREGADIQAEIESMGVAAPQSISAEEAGASKTPQDEQLEEIQRKLDECLSKNMALEKLHGELVKANEELVKALETSRRANVDLAEELDLSEGRWLVV